jgi:hypothetical protein
MDYAIVADIAAATSGETAISRVHPVACTRRRGWRDLHTHVDDEEGT